MVRKLLFFFEEKVDTSHVMVPPIAGYEEVLIKYHLVLLYDAGLIRCEAVRSSTSDRVIYVVPFDLTWDGHEFLEKIRNEVTWRRILTTVRDKGGALAFSVINHLATKLAIDVVT